MKKLFILISVVLFFGISEADKPKSGQITQPTPPLLSTELIQEAGWTYNWQMNLPLKPGEKISRLNVMGAHVYVMTDTNVLFCIVREEGRVKSVSQLSPSRLPVSRPYFYEGQIWFIVGNQMMVFDPAIGDFIMEKSFPRVGSSPKGGLARNNNYIYICGSDNRLHAINTDGYWRQFIATADNDSPIVSVIATDDIAVFATQAGNVIGMSPNEAEKLWQYDVTGPIKSQLVLDGDYVYVGSLDSKLYKLGLSGGKLAWKSPFHSGAPIRDTFIVGSEIVYLYNPLNGFYGVNTQTGQAVWQIVSGEGMICETPEKGFVYARPGVLKVMDNKTGKELYSVNFSSVERYAANTTDAVMYLSDTKGRLMSVTVK